MTLANDVLVRIPVANLTSADITLDTHGRDCSFKSDPTHSIVVKRVKIFKTEKNAEIQLVRPTEVCGKILSFKSVKASLLFSNVIDADH